MNLQGWIPVIIQILFSATTVIGILLARRKTDSEAGKNEAEANAIRQKSLVDTAQGLINASQSTIDIKDKLIESQGRIIEHMEKELADATTDRKKNQADLQTAWDNVRVLQETNQALTLKIQSRWSEGQDDN